MRDLPFIIATTLLLAGCANPATSPQSNPQLAQGAQLYQAHCARCHGANGEGTVEAWQQPNADGTMPPPPHNHTGHTWHHPDGHLFAIVANGGTAANSAMPAFGEQLSHAEIVTTLEFIKTFWSEETRAAQSRVSQTMPYPPAPPD